MEQLFLEELGAYSISYILDTTNTKSAMLVQQLLGMD